MHIKSPFIQMRRKQPLRGQVAAHGHAASEWWARAGTVLCVVFIQPSQVLAPPSAPFFPPWMWGKEKGLCGPGLTAGPLWEYYCDKSSFLRGSVEPQTPQLLEGEGTEHVGFELPPCLVPNVCYFPLFLFRTEPTAYGISQARGLHHSHFNLGSEPHL